MERINLRELRVTLVIAQIQLLVGFGYSFSALLIPKIVSDKESVLGKYGNVSWIATSSSTLNFLGAVLEMFIIDKIGRRGVLRLKIILFTVGWLIVALSQDTLTFSIGRLCSSIATGFVASHTIYISETCADRSRALLVSFPFIFHSIGILLGNTLQYFLSWNGTAAVATLLSFVTLLQTMFIPETKYWFMLRCKRREAAQSYAWFKSTSTPNEIQDELNKIERSVLKGMIKLEPVNMLDEPFVRKPFLISTALLIFRLGSGYLVFTHYSASFLMSLHIPYDISIITLAVNVCNVVAGILYCIFSNVCSRKNTLYICSTVMVPCMLAMAVSPEFGDKFPSLVLVACVFIYFFIASSAHFMVVYVILSEIFPSYVRGPIFSLCFAIQLIVNPIYLYLYPIVDEKFGIEYVCWFFILNMTLITVIVTFFLPETRNIPLYEAEELFEESHLLPSDCIDRQRLLEMDSIFEI